MADIIEPSGNIVPGAALVPYVHPTLTNKTPVAWPLLVSAFRASAILTIEWASLRWMEHAPDWAYLTSAAIALGMLVVVEQRDWLNFRRKQYFPVLIIFLFISWLCVIATAYYESRNSVENPPSAAVVDLTSKLAAALRERDIVISDRDSLRRERGDVAVNQPIAPIPQSISTDEIEERSDTWRGIEASMNELSDILTSGSNTFNNWKSQDRSVLSNSVAIFANSYENYRARLTNLLNANNQFSDVSVIKASETNKLSIYLNNLAGAMSQVKPTAPTDALAPYIGPTLRQIGSLKQWAETSKNVAESSLLDLKARKAAKTSK